MCKTRGILMLNVINTDVECVQPAESVPRAFAFPLPYDLLIRKAKRTEPIPHPPTTVDPKISKVNYRKDCRNEYI